LQINLGGTGVHIPAGFWLKCLESVLEHLTWQWIEAAVIK